MEFFSIEFLLSLGCAAYIAAIKDSAIFEKQGLDQERDRIELADQYPVTDARYGYTYGSPGYFGTEFKHFGKSLRRQSRVLDIGAAWRMVSSIDLLKSGHEVTVVESNQKELQVLVHHIENEDHLTVQKIEKKRNKEEAYSKVKYFVNDGWKKNLKTYTGRIENGLAPLPDNYFDAVMIGSVLHFLKPNEITFALKEIKRVLRPGGKIFIENQTPDMQGFEEWRLTVEKNLQQRNPHWWRSTQEQLDQQSFVDGADLIWPYQLDNREKKFSFLSKKTEYLNLFDLFHTYHVLRQAGFQVEQRVQKYQKHKNHVGYFVRDNPDSKTFHPENVEFRELHREGLFFEPLESVGGVGIKPFEKIDEGGP